VLTSSVSAHKRSISLTIDDLPFVGENKNYHLNMIIDAIKSNAIPATGFIIAKEVNATNWESLRRFHDTGLALGNHTMSHTNLNNVNAETYIQEIDRADKILSPVLTAPKFFRYPYLVMGNGLKKEIISDYLQSKNYQVAPISIDSKDFIFNQLLLSVPEKERRQFLTVLKPCYIDFIWQQTLKAEEHHRYNNKPDDAQILLIHANLLNAYVLPDIIKLYKQNGFDFVSLEQALNLHSNKIKLMADSLPLSHRSKTYANDRSWEEPIDEIPN
jgi:peptidoglycan/xylan/chitin deacetylase (PgdA/CDA1 family)